VRPDRRDPALHEARKKAKRLRYAAELARPAGGRHAKRLANRAKAVQRALGEHQDTVVARQRLLQLGGQAFLHGENGFTFGLLHGVERRRAERAEDEFWEAWSRMPRPRTTAAWVAKR
jgi:CHAD domain-containing protein